MDSWFEHLAEKPGPGWTALSETVHVSWLDSDDHEHEKTLTDGREAYDLIEAILRDEDLLLTGCKHRSRCEIIEGLAPRRVRVQNHASTMVGLYAESAAGAGDGSSIGSRAIDGPLAMVNRGGLADKSAPQPPQVRPFEGMHCTDSQADTATSSLTDRQVLCPAGQPFHHGARSAGLTYGSDRSSNCFKLGSYLTIRWRPSYPR